MINVFKIRKFSAIIMAGFIPTIAYSVGSAYYGIYGAVLFMVSSFILIIPIGHILLKNPFSMMLEGKGILVLNMDSTGIIHPFVVGVAPPYIRGQSRTQEVNDVFDRDAVFQIATPQKAEKKATRDIVNDKLTITLTENDYNKGRFAMFHFPCLFWNDQIKSILTKDFFSEQEKAVFAEHGILYLNRKMEELTSAVRDFARHVVELTKPQKEWFKNKWVFIIIAIAVAIFIFMFAPSIITAMKGVAGSATDAVSSAGNAVGGAPILPI